MKNKRKEQPCLLPVILFLIMAMRMILVNSPVDNIVLAAIDDGLYYPKIALNIQRLGFPTYDTITWTNGFHPLWEMILIPIYQIIHDPMKALGAVYWMITIITALAIFIYTKLLRKLNVSRAGLLLSTVILIFNMRSFTLWFSLLESHLVLLILCLFLYYSIKETRKPLLFGFIGGLLFLARTDTVFIAFVTGVFILIKDIRVRKLNKSALYLAGFLIPSLPYLLWNQVYFGSILPVSGGRKIDLNFKSVLQLPKVIGDTLSYISQRIGFYAGVSQVVVLSAFVIFFVLFLFVMFLMWKKGSLNMTTRVLQRLAPFAIGVFVHYLFIATFMSVEAIYSFWYLVGELLLFSILFAALTTDILQIKALTFFRPDMISAVILIIFVLLQVFMYDKFFNRRVYRLRQLEVIEYIEQNYDKDTLFLMYDSGVFSYLTDMAFISGNGLAGDHELARLVENSDAYPRIIDSYAVDKAIDEVPIKVAEKFSEDIEYTSSPVPFQDKERVFVIIDGETFKRISPVE